MAAVDLNMTERTSATNRAGSIRTIPVVALGLALSLFLVISYLICVSTYLIPGLAINHAMLTIFLPGFELLNWQSFCLGLFESFAWGWYVALIFGPLYNFFVVRWHRSDMESNL